jgi:TPR repeat protein
MAFDGSGWRVYKQGMQARRIFHPSLNRRLARVGGRFAVLLWLFVMGMGVSTYGQLTEALRRNFEETKAKAEGGNGKAQFDLGVCYELGKGVAAVQDHAEAQLRLGMCHLNGLGMKKNAVEAFAWFSVAADRDKRAGERVAVLGKELTSDQLRTAQKRKEALQAQFKGATDPGAGK